METELLQTLLDRLGIQQWDFLLCGDGSGSGWAGACGWAGVLIDRETRGRRLFYGAMNAGSVNFGEVMPYVHALNWLDANGGKERLERYGTVQVHILTDSQVTATWGLRAMSMETALPRKHIPIWAAMREYRRLGYVCHFHWAPRMTSGLNWAADLIAGLCRRGLLADGAVPLDVPWSARAANVIDAVRFAHPKTNQDLDIYSITPLE